MTANANRGARAIEESLRNSASGGAAVAAYLTAGFPTLESFRNHVVNLAREVDVLEIGVPFTDPMADGLTIQRASETALGNGVTLDWILGEVHSLQLPVPVVLMSYLNPLLSYGLESLVDRAAAVGVSGLIVPDLPLDSCGTFSGMCDAAGLALIQLVTPVSEPDRLRTLCSASRGFVYAVATTGITGGTAEAGTGLGAYLEAVREASDIPVLAGFGVRTPEQVALIASLVDGVVVGSALIEAIESDNDPAGFIRGLRGKQQTTGNVT